MFEQLAIFTPQGQVVYQFNCAGKKFAETQINSFLNRLLISPVTNNDTINGKYSILNVGPDTNKPNSRSFCTMFYVAKQPDLYFVITYAEQSLQLNQEAEDTLNLALALWESLDIPYNISENIKSQQDILNDLDDVVGKFDKYLRTKYEESVRYSISNSNSSENLPLNNTKTNQQSGNKNKKQPQKSTAGGRKWGRDGIMEDNSAYDSAALDFSSADKKKGNTLSARQLQQQQEVANVDKDALGNRTANGEFLIKEIDDLLSTQKDTHANNDNKSSNKYTDKAFGFLQRKFLGNKTIDTNDLESVLDKLRQKLVSKNVAPEVADYLTEQVSRDLVGSKTANWTSVENTARESLSRTLTKILTPGVSVDLLHDIQGKLSHKDKDGKKQPYVFSVVGVNGVGKSTNLSKLAFWLLQNKLKVLIVACDTFRSGAVEQLRVHVENLAQLTDESHVRGSKNRRGKSGNDSVELFEAGYGGSDLVTKIAKQAIKYAHDQDFDIVLMDTAGRRHNDPTLMSPLKAFAEQAKPDKIIMVGEALVGTDSVQQAKNFNDAFGKVRNLDFFIISKCDTVGEMLGTMVNMVYATGIPILFVGVGQTYTDLRTLSVSWAVNTLMS
ncbi:signal recognition particle receptor subunit alpha homolog [Monosporozyma unispora]|nr:hypothetical protein C6P44_003310 [Kazachstania unispora]